MVEPDQLARGTRINYRVAWPVISMRFHWAIAIGAVQPAFKLHAVDRRRDHVRSAETCPLLLHDVTEGFALNQNATAVAAEDDAGAIDRCVFHSRIARRAIFVSRRSQRFDTIQGVLNGGRKVESMAKFAAEVVPPID